MRVALRRRRLTARAAGTGLFQFRHVSHFADRPAFKEAVGKVRTEMGEGKGG
jgi:hypothetical protein